MIKTIMDGIKVQPDMNVARRDILDPTSLIHRATRMMIKVTTKTRRKDVKNQPQTK